MSIVPTKILVATDGSKDANLAVSVAVDLSERTGAELHVVHAWQGPPPMAYPAASRDYYLAYEREAEREAGGLLEWQVEWIRTSGGIIARAHLRRGRPAEEISGLAKELDTDLVVVGSRGLGTVKRLVVGSVSEGVVSLAPCPVLVMRGGEEAWPPRRLLIGDDGSEEARRAGELAAFIGKLFDARVFLVRVYYPQITYEIDRASSIRMSEVLSESVRMSYEPLEKGDASLEKRETELESILGCRLQVKVAVGDPAALIQEAAEEGEDPALVAVGSRGLGSVRRFTLGSTSTAILRAASGPVLIVSPLADAR
ncbi:MAG: universal stress protein [Actinomycetota bacterium]|nr:universal stress protein [Actinomycetota bacterium]